MHADPDSEPDDLIIEIEASGRRLVEALTDQLAAGQVETLYTLQTAAGQVRRHTAAVTGATESLAESLRAMTDQVTAEVQAGFARLLVEAQTSIGEQLAAEVDASSTELRGASSDHVQAVTSQLQVTSAHLADLYDGAAARTEDARQGLEWVAQQGAEQLTGAVQALQTHRSASEAALAAVGETMARRVAEGRTALDEAGASLAERVQAAGTSAGADLHAGAQGALQHLRDGVADLLQQVAEAGAELDGALLEARKAAETELSALRRQIQAAERREESVAERLEQHVDALVARTDATVGQSLAHLRAVADALLERDAQLEARRADEFARVLESVLKDGGASTRKLRERIFRGMETAKQGAPRAATPPAPVVEPAAPEPVAPPATQAPAKKAPAKQAAAKKAPRGKAAAAKVPKPGPDVVPGTTTLQEEQA
ncbi:MAG: hypothetical protein JWO22_570 [Frankiales bacterium]|nr:hypothetical protein [Frankiales bacterium]